MNFNIVSKKAIVIDDIYDDVKEDYCYSDLTNKEIREKYDLSYCDLRDISRRIKKEMGLSRRPTKGAKNYYKTPSGFAIEKKIKGNTIYLGTVPREDIAKKVVELCKNELWDIDKCTHITRNYWEYIV